MNKPNIVITVHGGVVTDVVGDAPFNYTLRDMDTLEEGRKIDVNPATAFQEGELIPPNGMQNALEDGLEEEDMDRN